MHEGVDQELADSLQRILVALNPPNTATVEALHRGRFAHIANQNAHSFIQHGGDRAGTAVIVQEASTVLSNLTKLFTGKNNNAHHQLREERLRVGSHGEKRPKSGHFSALRIDA